MENKDQPMFPVMMQQIGDSEYRAAKPTDAKEYNKPMAGLTKREYFAAMMMQGLLASWGEHDAVGYDEIASDAVLAADKLLSELSNPQP